MLNAANERQGVKLLGHLGGKVQRLFLCIRARVYLDCNDLADNFIANAFAQKYLIIRQQK